MSPASEKFFIVGGAGFIGSHFVDHLLKQKNVDQVTIYDNFTSGRDWHIETHLQNSHFKLIRGDVKDLDLLTSSMKGHDTVIHLASNPDIAKAATCPDIDFWEGTYLTQNVIEAMRRSSVTSILYASGSGVYGDLGETEATEDHSPLIPVSTYGASKLAGESLIASYCHMFGLRGRAFRFGNVVGPRQTHGVGFDFLKKLKSDSSRLAILGNGTQSKSYIHVFDVIDAVLTAHKRETKNFQVYNVATGDYITVTDIAKVALRTLGLNEQSTRFEYSGGDRGWKGDVPIVRLNTDRIRTLGWRCQKSTSQAIESSLQSMETQVRQNLI